MTYLVPLSACSNSWPYRVVLSHRFCVQPDSNSRAAPLFDRFCTCDMIYVRTEQHENGSWHYLQYTSASSRGPVKHPKDILACKPSAISSCDTAAASNHVLLHPSCLLAACSTSAILSTTMPDTPLRLCHVGVQLSCIPFSLLCFPHVTNCHTALACARESR